jgi:RNA polymerase sigma-70 factor, ECF subfamily
MTLQEERVLLARAQSGANGFGEFFDAYYDRIYAYAFRRVGSRQVAEDIASSVFEDALKGIKRLRWRNKPLAAWLYKIAARRVADFYRRPVNEELAEISIVTNEGPGSLFEQEEEFAAVRRGMDRLAAADRELIRLAYFDELDRNEIAEMLGSKTNIIYVRLHRALERLERILKDEKIFA